MQALDSALESSTLIIMDEIGRMELCSEAFQDAVARALDSSKPLLGTLQKRDNAFLDAIRARPDVELITVNTANRECLVPVLLDRLEELLES